MLSWFLLKAGQKVLVIDKFNPSSASNISAGITNPITGRRFVKTWLADELIATARETYGECEQLFNDSFFCPLTICKIFDSVKAQNDWSVRSAMPGYLPYLANDSIVYLDKEKVKNDFGGFEITGATRLDTAKFLSHYRNYLIGKNALLDEAFEFDQLQVETGSVSYKGNTAKAIIFCDGANAINNPYFKFFPFQLAKGECLIIEIEDFYTDKVFNNEVLILPLGGKQYYIGATHEWYFDDDQPSPKGKNELLGNLSVLLNAPFKIVDQRAAIRPTVKDRRPFIGFHPQYANVGIFNGMGTKGISLAPYFAKHFTQNILFKNPLMKEVDIKRFLS
jgi:glycine/D-amino acid oxidase-like deaminating enzyme